MQFLHDIFKSEESKNFLALGYITGILPIKKIKDESALNNFREFTMIDSKNLTKFYGFTEDDVRGLCEKYNMNFDSVHKWYNGYLINGIHMYNPNSETFSTEIPDIDIINEFTQIYNEEQEGKDIQTEADTMIIPEPTAWKTLLKEE